MRHRRRHGPIALIGLLALVIGLNVIMYYLAELVSWLLLAGVVVVLVQVRRTRRAVSPPLVPPGPAVDVTEAVRLRAENDELRERLADAEESAHAAWDVASDRPPASRADRLSPDMDRLLSAPLSGARPLGGDRP
jgi:hypothetical protein